MLLGEKIISVYRSLFSDLLNLKIPEESIATCDDCTLNKSDQSPYKNVKCCTYFPSLPNYHIGGILCNSNSDLLNGLKTIGDQIERKIGVTPYGIFPPKKYSSKKTTLDNQDFWSRSKQDLEELACPYLSEGKCTIWDFREHLCTTFFCSSIGGLSGIKFWKSVNQYLKYVEEKLGHYSIQKIEGLEKNIKSDPSVSMNSNLEDDSRVGNLKNYRKTWGKWFGREKEFYIRCYEEIEKLDTSTFNLITGSQGNILKNAIYETYEPYMQNIIPNLMIINPEIEILSVGDGKVMFVLNKASVEIPSVILPLIRGFDGKRKTVELFHMAYKVFYEITPLLDELRRKDMLIKA